MVFAPVLVVGVSVSGAAAAVGGPTLYAGETLHDGQSLGNGQYHLAMQRDGNLVLYAGSDALWQSGTYGRGAAWVTMQADGNLVVSVGRGTRRVTTDYVEVDTNKGVCNASNSYWIETADITIAGIGSFHQSAPSGAPGWNYASTAPCSEPSVQGPLWTRSILPARRRVR